MNVIRKYRNVLARGGNNNNHNTIMRDILQNKFKKLFKVGVRRTTYNTKFRRYFRSCNLF